MASICKLRGYRQNTFDGYTCSPKLCIVVHTYPWMVAVYCAWELEWSFSLFCEYENPLAGNFGVVHSQIISQLLTKSAVQVDSYLKMPVKWFLFSQNK